MTQSTTLRLPPDREILSTDETTLTASIERAQNQIQALMAGVAQQQQQITLLQNIIRRRRELEAQQDGDT